MKKRLPIILLIIFMLFITCSCKNNNKQNLAFKIVDTSTDIEGFSCAQALEKIYQDDSYTYSLPCIKSKYIIVEYNDDTNENIKEALTKNKIKITDLDKYNIKYYKRERKN